MADAVKEAIALAYKEPDYSKLKEISEGSLVAKLYQIIDTAFDMFKPEMSNFERYVSEKIDEKNDLVVSDGYKLFYAK